MIVAAVGISWGGQSRSTGQDAGDQQDGETEARSEAMFHDGSPRLSRFEWSEMMEQA
jgi:hypothetical protein